ncbi:MAG: hypothetical protein AAF721_24285 [Myxococcota bacterium]
MSRFTLRLGGASLATMLAACTTPGAAHRSAPGPEPGDRADDAPTHAAAKHDATKVLAARSQRWLDERACALSCHTTMPFVLAADRLGPDAATVRAAVVQRVLARVAAWDTVDVWYGSSPAKTAESRGTEAVLNALALATVEPEAAAPAFAHLVSTQRGDGAWDWLDFGLLPWEGAGGEVLGASLAAVAIGGAPAGAVPTASVQALAGFLERAAGDADLHGRLAVAWGSTKIPGGIGASVVQSATARAVALQAADGGWSAAAMASRGEHDPPAQASDAYATAFATFALAHFDDAGSRAAVEAGRGWLRKHQKRDGAWAGVSVNSDARFNRGLATDMATAFAVLALSNPRDTIAP